MTLLFFDTETTGLPKDYNAPYTNVDNFPRLVQIAWILYQDGLEISSSDCLVKPDGFEIPKQASDIHGFTTEDAIEKGYMLKDVLNKFWCDVKMSDMIVAHNINYDKNVYASEMHRAGAKQFAQDFMAKKMMCTMLESVDFCKIPCKYGDYKWPKLEELYAKLFDGEGFDNAHNALADIRATARCYFELEKLSVII